jgi:hypothetical protein
VAINVLRGHPPAVAWLHPGPAILREVEVSKSHDPGIQ